MKKRIAIFASGSGTNAEAIMHHFTNHSTAEVVMILSNKSEAYVLERAKKFDVPTYVFDRETFYYTQDIVDKLKTEDVSLIVLAGFLWLVPEHLVSAFPSRIINIHPALLPKYGGKGMYGMKVHQAVKEAGETESGITIHYVNQHYDEGQIIHQGRCELNPEDSPEDIATKVHLLEHEYYPKVIENLIDTLN